MNECLQLQCANYNLLVQLKDMNGDSKNLVTVTNILQLI